jgi:hypothetical protein
LGRIADALPHFQRAVSLKPDFAEVQRNLDAAQVTAQQHRADLRPFL